jgi:hypothetical protein
MERASAIRSSRAVLWEAVAGARSVAPSVDRVGRVEPIRGLSLDVPAAQHLAELILYTSSGRRRRLPVRGGFDRAA